MDSPCVPSLRAYNGEALFAWFGANTAASVAADRAVCADVGPAGDADLAGYIEWGCCDEGQCKEEEAGECGEADGCHYCFLCGGDVAKSALEGVLDRAVQRTAARR